MIWRLILVVVIWSILAVMIYLMKIDLALNETLNDHSVVVTSECFKGRKTK